MKKSWLTASATLTALGSLHAGGAAHATTLFKLDPTSLDFGDVLVGETDDLKVKIAAESGVTVKFAAPDDPFSTVTGKVSTSTKTYEFAPTARGTYSDDLTVSASDGKLDQKATLTLSGVGVAPQESTSVGTEPIVRIGTSGLATVKITNVGDGNLADQTGQKVIEPTNLQGKIGSSSGAFSGKGGSFSLKDNAAKTYTYTFTPTDHGAVTGKVNVAFTDGSPDGENQAYKTTVKLPGLGVGPVFTSSTADGGTIDFGTVGEGESGFADLIISNTTDDRALIKAAGGKASSSLLGLSLLDADVSGTGFQLDDFTATVLGAGQMIDLKIDFTGGPVGLDLGTLTLTTDQDAAFGSAGDVFSFNLEVDVDPPAAPEPGSAGLIGAGLASLLAARRKQRS